MNWFKFFRLVSSQKRPISKKTPARPRHQLALEALEPREVPATPTVLSVVPATGGSLTTPTTPIVVSYSIDVSGADLAVNYRLFGSDGTAFPIVNADINYNPVTFQATITPPAGLTAGAYSLFLRGDQIADAVVPTDTLAAPGQIVVANSGRGNLSTVSLTGSNLGAVQTVGLPLQGATAYMPTAAAAADVNYDGLNDLLVASSGFNNVSVYLGDPLGGFSSVADLTLALPAGAAPSAILVTQLISGVAGKRDVVVANKGTDNVSVFLNQNTTAGELLFSTATNFAAGDSPVALAVGQLGVGAGVDLVVANSTLNTDYVINVLTGNNDGTFVITPTPIIVGLAGADLTVPSSIAVGDFNGAGDNDIVVGGATGVSILLNTSTLTAHTFGATFLAGPAVTSLGVGQIRANGNGRLDVVTTTSTGQLVAYLNNGGGAAGAAGTFRPTDVITAGVASPTGLQLRDLNGTGTAQPELVYVNGALAGGAVSRSPLQTGLISAAVSTATMTTITSNGHGLVNGQRVIISGATYLDATPATVPNPNANGTFYITGVTANTFQLVGVPPAGALTGDVNTGTWLALPGIITGVTNATDTAVSATPITIDSPNHGLRTGQQITIAGVGGLSAGVNGTFFITRVSASQFTLNGTDSLVLTGTYTANTGTVTLVPYATGATPLGVAIGDFTGDNVNDLVTVNNGTPTLTPPNSDNTLSFFTGSVNSATSKGDGTFLAATNLQLSGAGTRDAREPVVGDLNKDGLRDLITIDTTSDNVNVFLALKGGGYAAPQTFSPNAGGNSRDPVSVTLGDLNGDGRLDMVTASSRDSNVAVFLNTTNVGGPLTFANATRFTVGNTPTQVMLADVNNDGDLDLLVAHNGGGGFGGGNNRGVTIRLGNGDGTFQAQSEIADASGRRATALGIADFNQDNNLDIAVTNDNTPGSVRLLTGAGNGTFTNGGDFTVGSNPTDLTVADFDNDGFTDIATVSRNNTTTDNVSVLLNSLGTGFQTAVNTTVTSGLPLQSLAALNVNSDAFIDLVVTSRAYDPPGKGSPPPPPNPINNTHVLLGTGDGGFATNIDDYSVDIPTTTPTMGAATPVPSRVAIVSDPFRLLSTFNIGGTTVSVNLIRNGNFDARDLTNEQGNLTGWNTYKLRDTTRGSAGAWGVQTLGTSPLSGTTVPPPSGKYQAMLDQQNLQPFSGNNNPNADDTYAGSHAIYQDIMVPLNASSVKLSFSLYLNSATAWTDAANNPALDYRTGAPNQQVRVDIMSTTGDLAFPNATLGVLGVTNVGSNGNVLLNVLQTLPTDALTGTRNLTGVNAINLSAFAGMSIRLRIAATNNQGKLIVGLDNVRIQTVFTDTIQPSLDAINLRNPSFLAGPNTLEQSTDPTIVGLLSDNGSINNVKQVTFDLGNNGFGGADDVNITAFDANGYFTFTPTTLLSGIQTVPVQVVDQAGQAVTQNFQFVLQGPSLTNWASAGPGPIDISTAQLNYTTVSGKITGIAMDPSDPSGNTFYVGSANGGVWKTTDGGRGYLAVTDNVTDPSGQRVNVSVGGLTLGVNPAGTVKAIYAATGVDDVAFSSRSSIGVLRSLDNGRTWAVLNNANVFTGARVSKIVVDPSNPDIVYVSVASWDTPNKQPNVFRTGNGTSVNPTWVSLLTRNNMFVGNTPLSGAGLPGTMSDPITSVTDLLVDPFNPQRLIIGMGNIGYLPTSGCTGVWLSTDSGANWLLQQGGDSPDLASNLSLAGSFRQFELQGKVPNGAEPFLLIYGFVGPKIGRITLSQGTGRVGDEKFVYALIADASPGTNPGQFDNGGYMGLYKSKNNMLDFTSVMLKQPGFMHNRFTENYVDIGLVGDEGSTVGALSVDPSNPNVVYVGGSRRFDDTTTPQHALIRVDTGNMQDADYVGDATLPVGFPNRLPNDGDDRDKASAARNALGIYPVNLSGIGPIGGVGYNGEGVYWYDIEQGEASDSGMLRRLPTAIHRITFDTQGRLLFGTENGLYRGTALGFGYDFDSAYDGILDGGFGGGGGGGFGGGGPAFNPTGMTITELNGNLQITDVTSVAIDPTNRNTLYISASGVGTATSTAGPGAWQSTGLTGPTVTGAGDLGIPNSFQIVAANLAPGAPIDSVTTLYRTWQYNRNSQSLIPEVSIDAGGTFSTSNSAGISAQDTSNIAPVLAINTKKVVVGADTFDELLFGTNKVYLSRTSGNVFDQIPGSDLGAAGAEKYSALAFSVFNGVYLAGTDTGRVFRTSATSGFTNITSNLTAVVGTAFRINGITVDPRDPTGNTIYVMLGTPLGSRSVYRTTNGGAGANAWSAVPGSGTGFLPLAAAYKLVIDPRPSTGALNGRFYVGTDRGVFTSVDNGASWQSLGNGLPAAPVVGLEFNPDLETLAAATQGRGVFVLSTARLGPAVVTATPGTPVTTGGLTTVTVTFDAPVDPRTFTADANNTARAQMTLIPLTSNAFVTNRINALLQKYIPSAVGSQAAIDFGRGLYFNSYNPTTGAIAQTTSVFLGGVPINATRPDGEFLFISYLVADQGYYNSAAGSGTLTAMNTAYVEKLYMDLFGRTSVGDPQTAGIVSYLNANGSMSQPARLAVARQLTGLDPQNQFGDLNPLSREFHTNVVADLFNRHLARNYPAVGASSDEITAKVTLLQTGPPIVPPGFPATIPLGTQLLYVTAGVLSTTEAYQKMGNDYALPAGVNTTAIATANLTGAVDSFNVPILDLIVGGSDDTIRIFQGRAGGGYDLTPTLTLTLPGGAAPGDLVIADFNNNGRLDLAVANSGLAESASNNTLSLFLNTRSVITAASWASTAGGRVTITANNTLILGQSVAISGITGSSVPNGYNGTFVVTSATATSFTYALTINPGTATLNNAATLSFGARTDLNAGGQPVGIAAGDVDGDSIADLVVANQALYDNNTPANGADDYYTASVLLGNGAAGIGNGTFTGVTVGSATRRYQVANNDATVTVSEVLSPTDIALGNVTGDSRNDLIISGATGVTVLTNTTTVVGTPTVSLLANRLTGATPVVVTSVAVGDLDADADVDIVATADTAAGQVLVFQNAGASVFTPTTAAVGANPRSVRLGDMNGDARPDLVVANDSLTDPALSILFNTTTGAGTLPLTFESRLAYPVTGVLPAAIALGDTNQDGVLDVVIGYEGSEFVSQIVGEQQGILKVATDRNWLDSLSRSLSGRPLNQAERNALPTILATSAPAVLLGPTGSVSPLSITPNDSTNLTYTATFAPQLFDGTYGFYIIPNILNIVPKDFIDQNGTYANTGNQFNQNANAANGEVPTSTNVGDLFGVTLTVNHTDSGRFIAAAYTDLLGRAPDNPSFANQNDTILEPARLASLNSVARSLIGTNEEVDRLMTMYYQQYLRRVPTGAELVPARNYILSGGTFGPVAAFLIDTPEYFASAGGTNAGWVNRAYMDTLGLANVASLPAGVNLVNSLNAGTITRTQVANILVVQDAWYQRTVSGYFVALLGRTPVRNADPALDETTPLVPLLRTARAAGQPTGDQQVVLALVSSPEYLRVHGNSNFEWLKSIYTTALGRPSILTTQPSTPITAASWSAGTVTITANNVLVPSQNVTVAGIAGSLIPNGYNGTFTVVSATATSFTYALTANPGTATVTNATAVGEFNGVLTTVLGNYFAARETILGQLVSSLEYRNRQYTSYYADLIPTAGPVRVPTQAELDFAENLVYQPYGQRLELVQAYITSLNEYFLLSGSGSSNSGWLTNVYSDLLNQSVTGNLAAQRLAYLDSQTPNATNGLTTQDLANARLLVAYDITNGILNGVAIATDFRRLLVNRIYVTYLGRAATIPERDFWVARMNNPAIADTEQTIIRLLLRGEEYFRFRAL